MKSYKNYKPLVVTQKLARLEKLTALLLDEFKSEGIQVFPVLKIEDKNPIDLFVRFERKIHLFISIRSIGDDETSFAQGNIDGCNEKKTQAWLWVMVTPLVAFFEITLSRCTQTAKNLLGEHFRGILNSDRYASYNWVGLEQRQLCWAHLKREFIKISERTGVSKQIGEAEYSLLNS